mgnify:FL=1
MTNNRNEIRSRRLLMKSTFAEEGVESDQQKQLPQPPLTKEATSGGIIKLTEDFSAVIKKSDYLTLVMERKSNSVYKKESVTL